MNRYYVHPSFTDDMGSYVGFYVFASNIEEARDKEALWQYNSARDREGLPRWDKLPPHIKVIPVKGAERL